MRLKKYRRSRQKFPLQLAPLEEQDGVTQLYGRLKEECEETDPTVERLDLGRDVAANRSPSDAPPHRPPVPNRGASATPPNWSCSLHRSEGSNRTRRREHCHRACGRQRPGGFPSPQGVVSGRRRNPNRATTRWSVRLRSESTCMRGGSPQGTPSHCISLQSKSTMMFQWIARSGLSQGG